MALRKHKLRSVSPAFSTLIDRVGGPKRASQWLAVSGIEGFSTIAESTVGRWLKRPTALPDAAKVAMDLFRNGSDPPNAHALKIAMEKLNEAKSVGLSGGRFIPDAELTFAVIPHHACLPLVFLRGRSALNGVERSDVTNHLSSADIPAPPLEAVQSGTDHGVEAKRVALGFSVRQVPLLTDATTIDALQAVAPLEDGSAPIAHCTVAPRTTFYALDKVRRRELISLCRIATVSNVVLAHGAKKGEPVKEGETIALLYEKINDDPKKKTNLQVQAERYDSHRPDDIKCLRPKGIKTRDWSGAAAEFRENKEKRIRTYLWGSQTFNQKVFDAVNDLGDELYFEDNRTFTGTTDWFLFINRDFFRPTTVRPLLKALNHTISKMDTILAGLEHPAFAKASGLIEESEFAAAKEGRLCQYTCDHLNPKLIEIW